MDGSEILAAIDVIHLVARALRAVVRGVRTVVASLTRTAWAYLHVFWLRPSR
ncbi:MAG TPA: hypothetical protein VHL98_07005 [Microvirga sp.]|jgi:hypothetical protein|nr:hypothetical protein [Microvirga sp.]